MASWSNSYQVRAPCGAGHMQRDPLRSVCRRFRSTKGASKARRDHINHEIRNMRALLPVSQDEQERLSYLHSMAAICTYIRKSVLFRSLSSEERPPCSLPYEAFLEALHGFILVTTAKGRLVYVSENVTEYLGLSMLDVLQGDTLYDLVERSDEDTVRTQLDVKTNPSPERSFVCCMQSSKAFRSQHGGCCSMLVRGGFQFFPQPSSAACTGGELLFVALCTPTVNRLTSAVSHFCHNFSSTHGLDMIFSQLSDSVFYYLGCPADEMANQSWYSLVHPEDLSQAANSHKKLLQAEEGCQVEMVLRLQRTDLSWTWLYIRASKECQRISCSNFIISETEAKFLQKKIKSDAFRSSLTSNLQSFTPPGGHRTKNQRGSNSQSKAPAPRGRKKSERDVLCMFCSSRAISSLASLADSPVLFTPPCSPTSSGSSPQQGELNHDLLLDSHECADLSASSPEAPGSSFSPPEATVHSHRSPVSSLPEHFFEQSDLFVFGNPSPLSPLPSPTHDFQTVTSYTQLVPDRLSMSEVCENPTDCTSLHMNEFEQLENPPGGDLFHTRNVPQPELPSLPILSESAHPGRYDEREQVEISILAQQISSLASSFSVHHGEVGSPACDWHLGSPPHEDCVFDSILTDLDGVTGKSHGYTFLPNHQQSSAGEPAQAVGLPADFPLPVERFTTGCAIKHSFSLQLGRPQLNTGLHQLHHSHFNEGEPLF